MGGREIPEVGNDGSQLRINVGMSKREGGNLADLTRLDTCTKDECSGRGGLIADFLEFMIDVSINVVQCYSKFTGGGGAKALHMEF